MKFTIQSDYSEAREVQKSILDEVARQDYDGNTAFAIKLALEEALINAVKHGNKLDSSKKVHVEASVTTSQTEIVIEDEGAGFDRDCVPDPTANENLEKCSGRGILLIEAYMDSVEWTNKGRRLRIVKKNANDGKK